MPRRNRSESLQVRARQRLGRMVTNNIGFKVLALGFAVGAWAWVQSEQVIEKRTRARVRYIWPETLTRVEEVNKTLVLTVRGPQGRVRNLPGSLEVEVDLHEAEEGTIGVDFTERHVEGLPPGIEVVQISPPAIDVKLDKKMTRSVRVKPVHIGEPDVRVNLVSVEVEPTIVEIVGPQSLVRGISEVTTDIIDISGVLEDRVVEAPLALSARTVRPLLSEPVKVTIDVEDKVTERTFGEVVIATPIGWSAEPAVVKVVLVGPAQEVSALRPTVAARLPEVVDPGGGPMGLTWPLNRTEAGGLDVEHGGGADVSVSSVEPRSVLLQPSG